MRNCNGPTQASAAGRRLQTASDNGRMKSLLVCVCVLQFEGQGGEEFQEQASQLCSQHTQAVELIKNKKRKDPRFAQIIQVDTNTHTNTRSHTHKCVVSVHHELVLLLSRSVKPVLTAGGCS